MTSTEAAATIQVIGVCEQALASLRNLFTNASPKECDDRTRDRQVQKLLAAVQDNLKVLEQKKVLRIGNKVDDLRQLTKALAPNDDNMIARTNPSNLLAKQSGSPATYKMEGTGTQINNPAVYCEGPSGMWRLISHNANLNANLNRETSEKRFVV
jgi:murein L,D-transpeptidase YcbB/YkuD